MHERSFDICIVGGCGHVGLPLGLAFAQAGQRVVLYDISNHNVSSVLEKRMPFKEEGAQPILEVVVDSGHLTATTDASVIQKSAAIIMVIGTPVDEYLNPKTHEVWNAVEDILPYVHTDQLLVMRSTLYPGTTNLIARRLEQRGIEIDVAFCPERIAEGYALTELHTLPQLVSGITTRALERATKLFSVLAEELIPLPCEEAELAKLMTNTFRYILFAAANEFWMIAEQHGLDYSRMLTAMKHNYPRLRALPGPGFAAGPCLHKDNQQLDTYAGPTHLLGAAAMLINEGQPDFLVRQLALQLERDGLSLADCTVGILGMAFKGDSDDRRASLSYKLRKVLLLEAGDVLCSDPFIDDPRFVGLDELVTKSDIIIVATPHSAYRGLDLGDKRVVDMWNIVQGVSA